MKVSSFKQNKFNCVDNLLFLLLLLFVMILQARLDSTSSNSLPESRVLHIRGLPSDVNELEVSTLSIPFGSIANIILTRKNGQVCFIGFNAFHKLPFHFKHTSCLIRGSHNI